jgi:hypothetical protein
MDGMNPSSSEQSPGVIVAPAETGQQPAEQAAFSVESVPTPTSPGLAAPPIIPLPPLSDRSTTAATAPAAAQDDTTTVLPSVAMPLTDDDLIEKEWVNKAKAIVERTRDDPYKQSEELTLVKADYMKKHYNKTIKQNK